MLPQRESAAERRRCLEREVERMVPLLKKRGAQRIILFGSLARQGSRRPADIDLMVVMPTKQRFLDRLDELYRLLDCPMALDLLVYTPEEFEQMRHTSSLVRQAVREGRVLYAAQT